MARLRSRRTLTIVTRAALPVAAVAALVIVPTTRSSPAPSTQAFDPLTPAAATWSTGGGAVTTAHVLGFNDLHGYIDPSAGLTANGASAGGAAYLAKTIKDLRAEAATQGQPTVTVSAGDNIGASPLNSAASHDEAVIDAENAFGVDLASVGNHEFDEGITELKRIEYGNRTGGPFAGTDACNPKDGCYLDKPWTGAAFPYLAANVVDHRTGKPLFPPYVVKNVGGVRVGFIGETLRGTKDIVNPAGIAGWDFLDEATTANTYAKQLSRQGVHAIVLVIHQGGAQNKPAGSYYDPNRCEGYAGDITPIVAKLDPAVRVVVSGHTHRYYTCVLPNAKGTSLVTSAGYYGQLVTDLSMQLDRRTGEIDAAAARNVVVTNGGVQNTTTGVWTYNEALADPAVLAIAKKYDAKVATIASRVLGTLSGPLTRTGSAAGESTLGDVIADGMVAYTSGKTGTASFAPDLALMNPGGIRNDLGAGQVTYGQGFAVQPFNNLVVTVDVTGAVLKQVLEDQFAGTNNGVVQPYEKILQVSSSVKETINRAAPAGSRITSVTISGQPLDPAKVYHVTTNDFLANGGDSFEAFTKATARQTAPGFDIDSFAAYLASLPGGVPVPALDRITAAG